jgi:hypothetical protein
MRDVTGKGCNKPDAPVRNDLPLHDMTGGNTWVPDIIAAFFSGETDPAALAAGKQRAASMLQKALMLEVTGTIPNIIVKVTNQGAHKLPSGYPEGRRLWINVKAYDAADVLLAEFGSYDYATATLSTSATKVYEVRLGMSSEILAATGLSNEADGSSFHFVLNNMVVKDNRIPPRGFTNAAFKAIQSPPVGYSYADAQYWDATPYTLPTGTSYYVVNLYYQTTSRDYVEFLRDENHTNDYGTRLYNAWASSGKAAPVLLATFSSRGPVVDTEPPTTPTNLTAIAQRFNLVNLSWNPSTDNVGVAGYSVYRTDKGTTPIATVTTTTYADGTVKATTTYSYYVKAFDAAGNRSASSNTVTVTTPRRTNKEMAGSSGYEHGLKGLSPNPFNPSTTVSYSLSVPCRVVLEVVDVAGRIVSIPVAETQSEGEYVKIVDASAWPSGVYFFRLKLEPMNGSTKATTNVIKGMFLK